MKNARQTAIIRLTAVAVFVFATISARAAIYTWNGGTSSDWLTAGNWDSGNIAPTDGTYAHRLNLGTTGTAAVNPLFYTAAQGATLFNPTDRGLVIYRASTMEIQGGAFSTSGNAEDLIGLNGETAALTIAGGTYNSSYGLVVGFSSHGIFNVNSGAVTISTLKMSLGGTVANDGTLNLNGGTLSVNIITAGTGTTQTTTVLLNGGTLIARTNNTAFISANLDNLLVGAGGAEIDTAGFDVTIPKAITPDGVSTGGLTKSGAGTLTLSAANTYAGETIINDGSLHLSGSGSVTNSNVVTINGTGALVLNNTADDAIGDDKRLSIADGVTVQLDSSDTVNELYIANRVKQLGTWGAPGNVSVDFKDSHFAGDGVLTVLTGNPMTGTLILIQ